ncbi:hypothetical protein ACJZ2D_005943 [Fusarium nematophilum]
MQKPTVSTARPESPDGQVFDFEVHSKLITTPQLVQRLEKLLPGGSFNIQMRHNIYHVHVDTRPSSPTATAAA